MAKGKAAPYTIKIEQAPTPDFASPMSKWWNWAIKETSTKQILKFGTRRGQKAAVQSYAESLIPHCKASAQWMVKNKRNKKQCVSETMQTFNDVKLERELENGG